MWDNLTIYITICYQPWNELLQVHFWPETQQMWGCKIIRKKLFQFIWSIKVGTVKDVMNPCESKMEENINVLINDTPQHLGTPCACATWKRNKLGLLQGLNVCSHWTTKAVSVSNRKKAKGKFILTRSSKRCLAAVEEGMGDPSEGSDMHGEIVPSSISRVSTGRVPELTAVPEWQQETNHIDLSVLSLGMAPD